MTILMDLSEMNRNFMTEKYFSIRLVKMKKNMKTKDNGIKKKEK